MPEILLESGTNELELLEFTVGDQLFGVNVAKVTEIMKYQAVTKIPASDPSFEGIFSPRDKVISVIDLHKVLKKDISEGVEGIFVICHFNKLDVAFHVTSIQGICRISWEDIDKPPEISNSGTSTLSTGIAKIDGHIVLILDFEKIVSDLNTTAVLDTTGIEKTETSINKHIVIAEDSIFLNNMIVKSLADAGYIKVSHFENGKDAWEFISNLPDAAESISCVISDIEMPQMDGHRLLKLVREDERFKTIPFILFSSLISEEMRRKGVKMGANGQIAKPEINQLIGMIDDLIFNNKTQV